MGYLSIFYLLCCFSVNHEIIFLSPFLLWVSFTESESATLVKQPHREVLSIKAKISNFIPLKNKI